MKANPLVSVIIPVYNGEKYLAHAIESVLSQSYQPIEIVVVDDGSEDRTAEIARSYSQAQYVFQANRGVAGARNSGVQAASGEWVTFLDHDDIMLPASLQGRMDYLSAHPEIQCLIAKHQSFLEPGVEIPFWITPEHLENPQFGFGYLIAKKTFLEEVGGFDPKYQTMENLDLFYRAKDMGYQIAKFPEVVVLRRVHTSNTSRDVMSFRTNLIKMTRASIMRQRESQDIR